MFSMQYLDALANTLGDSYDRRPLVELIRRGAVIWTLEARGYAVSVIGSGFDVTPEQQGVEQCFNCGPTFPGFMELSLLSLSPFRALAPWTPFYDAHRSRWRSSLESLRSLPRRDGRPDPCVRHFAPHPPYLLTTSGALPDPSRPFDIGDEAQFRGSADEYRTGYRDQVLYLLNKELPGIVAAVTRDSPHGAIVVLSGDHGPALRFDPDHPSPDGLREGLRMFLAIRWPETGDHPAPIPPVNLVSSDLQCAVRDKTSVASKSKLPGGAEQALRIR